MGISTPRLGKVLELLSEILLRSRNDLEWLSLGWLAVGYAGEAALGAATVLLKLGRTHRVRARANEGPRSLRAESPRSSENPLING